VSKGRLEAFSDGVIAIIITIMVLELRPPEGVHVEDLQPLIPKIGSYVLSFVFVGIYWNNHHHLLQAAQAISGRVLWANLNLLFWLSLIPFGTAWMGEHDFASVPVILYGLILLGCAFAYTWLARSLLVLHPEGSKLREALGRRDRKGEASILFYVLGILTAWFTPYLAVACYVLVAAIWFVPDRRIERVVGKAA
jgi:uncharacterized membrane protein